MASKKQAYGTTETTKASSNDDDLLKEKVSETDKLRWMQRSKENSD